MITTHHSFVIQIEIMDATEAITNKGTAVKIASKIPFINRIVDRQIEEKIENEIKKHLSTEAIQKQILRTLNDNGVQAVVRVM